MEHYKLGINLSAKSIEISSHDKQWVESKVKEFETILTVLKETASQPIKSEEEDSANSTKQKNKIDKLSINEFYKKYIQGLKINSRIEIATFFAYYLKQKNATNDFSGQDIKDLYKEVAYPGWNTINMADVLSKAKQRAFLNNVSSRWSLSLSGEDFVLGKIATQDGN